MDQQTREILAILEYIKEKSNEEKKKRLDRISSLLEKLGNARWQRDVITDLALKRGIEETTKDKSVIR
jgi:folylpolyglutamate synthase/dihydropteroate synthase